MARVLQVSSLIVSVLLCQTFAAMRFQKMDTKILDPSKGTCNITVHPTVPKSVDVDVHSFIEAKDISVS